MCNKQSSQQLLELIEKDALKDISSINIPDNSENKIDINLVNTWYIETEKLIRILANTLPATMTQPINQLRYAGHHILKSVMAIDETVKNSNLVEAYKHCKRGYFDAIDLYVFQTTSAFKEKIAFLPQNIVKECGQLLEKHLKSIDTARIKSDSRIEYYSTVAELISEGLPIINKINLSISKNIGSDSRLKPYKELLIENRNLDTQVKSKLAKAEKKFGYLAFALTIFIVLATFLGLVFDGLGTQWVFKKSNIELNITGMPIIEHTDLDRITSK